MASANTSVANTQRWREWKAANPGDKDKYPNVASFLKDFPTSAANYQKAMNASAANANAKKKKGSFKNRVKGFFSKVGSRFSRKKPAAQANKNFVAEAQVQELNEQTKELKNLLQRQVENAGDLNMNNATKKIVQDNIETTRKLIEARQKEVTNREAKEKLEELKKNIASVGNVVEKAPANADATSPVSSLGNTSALKAAAVNALKRMGGMDGVAEQLAELKKLVEDCCEEGGMGRGRSGSVSSVATNKRGAANEANGANGAKKFSFNNEGWNEARNLAGQALGNAAAPGARPNLFEPAPRGMPKGRPGARPNLFEPAPRGMPKGRAANNMPSPAGLFGSNNFEYEPEPEREAPSPAGLFGSNNFENEPAPAAAPAGLPAGPAPNNAPERINEYGTNVGNLFSNAKNAPKGVKIARGNNSAPERINEYGANVGNLFSGAKNAPKNYKVHRGVNQPEPSPAGLFGSNNFENEPAPAAAAANANANAARAAAEAAAANADRAAAEAAAANAAERAAANRIAREAANAARAAEREAARAEREARVAANRARQEAERRRVEAEVARLEGRRNAARAVARRRGTDEEYFGLAPGFTERELEDAYRNLRMMHPNRGGTAAEYQNLGQRYNRLRARFAGAAENPFDEYELEDLYALRNAGEEAFIARGTRAQLAAAIRAKGGVMGGKRRTLRKKRTVTRKKRKSRKNRTNRK